MEYMSTQSGSQHHTLSLLERRETYTIMTIIRIMTVTVIGEEGDIHDNDDYQDNDGYGYWRGGRHTR